MTHREAPTRRSLLRAGAAVPAAALLAGCDHGRPSASSSPKASSSAATSTSPSSASPSPSPSPSRSRTAALALQPGAQRSLVRGLEVPWSIVFLPGGDALVSCRDTGQVLRIGPDGRRRVAGEVPGVVSSSDAGGEGGLLGLALHPRFRQQPWVYAYHTTDSDNRVVRMPYDGGRLGRPRLVLDGIRTSLHHNGGGLAFAPDGRLFVSTGDAENPSDAQDRGSLNGKVLRVTDTGRVPRGNPFGGPVWSYGHRNVEGLAFDETGALWASEFGDQARDELNHVERGANYGWPEVEGGDGPGGYHDPIASWPTDECSPSGVTVLHGRAWLGALQGRCVYSVVLRGPRKGEVRRHWPEAHGRIRAVAAAPDGSLWVGTSNRDGRAEPLPGDDQLFRVGFA